MVTFSACNRDAASAYIILARENQQTAELFIDNNKHKSAAFCIEQCVEQSLIAFAFCLDEAVGKRTERGGDIASLYGFLERHLGDCSLRLPSFSPKQLNEIETWRTKGRYPGAMYVVWHPSIAEQRELENVLDVVSRWLCEVEIAIENM